MTRKIVRPLAVMMAAALMMTACGGQTEEAASGKGGAGTADTADTVERKDYTVLYSSELTTLNYLKSSTNTIAYAADLTVDPLIEFDKYGCIKPCLATDWEISEDKKTYTFHIREGVKWYTWDGKEYGEEVTAHNFVDSAKYVLTQENASATSQLLYNFIDGAKAYFDGETDDFSTVGVKALDDHTLEYTLLDPTPYFLKMMNYVSYRPVCGSFVDEVGADIFGTSNDTILYNGAYFMDRWEPENIRGYVLNENYWDKENIFLDTITYKYNKEAKAIGPELFLRGETDSVTLPTEIVGEWLEDPEKSQYLTPRPMTSFSYYYGLNFEPAYEEEYRPEDWKKAVNNKNFRKSLFHGVDRVAALMTLNPYNAEEVLTNTITLRGFAYTGGLDYVDQEPLKEFTENDSFNEEKALEYKEKAMEELSGSVTFPIMVVMPYSTGGADLANRAQVTEQQLENLLGTDYIDVVAVPYAPTGFLTNTRTAGVFSMQELNWGPDYADPSSYTDTMVPDSSVGEKYSKPYLAEDCMDENGNSIYVQMIEKARAEKTDIAKRYQLFAEAEQYLLDNALVIPFYVSGGKYDATYLDPFSGNCGQFGRIADKLKGKVKLDKPMTPGEYEAALEKYEAEKEEALKNDPWQ